jgi:hypothetical protein
VVYLALIGRFGIPISLAILIIDCSRSVANTNDNGDNGVGDAGRKPYRFPSQGITLLGSAKQTSALIEICGIPSHVSQEGSTTRQSSGFIRDEAEISQAMVHRGKGDRAKGHHCIRGPKMMKDRDEAH